MADETDLREFVHERFRRADEKLDKVLDILADMRTTQTGIVQLLAAHDQRLFRIENRLDRIEKRLDLVET